MFVETDGCVFIPPPSLPRALGHTFHPPFPEMSPSHMTPISSLYFDRNLGPNNGIRLGACILSPAPGHSPRISQFPRGSFSNQEKTPQGAQTSGAQWHGVGSQVQPPLFPPFQLVPSDFSDFLSGFFPAKKGPAGSPPPCPPPGVPRPRACCPKDP